jgi:hypothetical protein
MGVRSVSSWFAAIVSPVLRPLMVWVAGLVVCRLTACRDAGDPVWMGLRWFALPFGVRRDL